MQTLSLGPPAEGTSFYPRKEPIRRLWALLGSRHDVLLLDPRRVGKTSVLRQMQKEGQRTCTAYCSFEGAADEAAIFAKLYAEAAGVNAQVATRMARGRLFRHAGRLVKLGAAGVSIERSDASPVGWRELADEFVAVLADTGEDWVLLTDELPLFLRALAETEGGRARVDALLGWFRASRQAANTRVRWLFAGSIGLDTLTRRWGMVERINDLRVEHLGPLSSPEAPQFVRWAADRVGLAMTPEAVEELVLRTGWPVPYHLALMVQAVADLPDPAAPDAVERAFSSLLDRARRTHFETWDQRLDRQLGPADAGLARALLVRAAAAPEGCSLPHARSVLGRGQAPDFAERFAFVWDVMQADGYLVQSGGRALFRSPLLRAWWARHGRRR